jgi:hypothetical protein
MMGPFSCIDGSHGACAFAEIPPKPIDPKKANPKTNDLILLVVINNKVKN